MSPHHLNIIQAIETAMEAEQKASAFYRDAAEKVVSERGKDLLGQLAEFERNHYRKLGELKSSLAKEKGYVKYEGTHLEPYRAASEVSGEIEDREELTGILNLAIKAETEASERYRRLAEETEDSLGKAMFGRFADEELNHRRILSDEYYQMQNRGGIWFWGD